MRIDRGVKPVRRPFLFGRLAGAASIPWLLGLRAEGLARDEPHRHAEQGRVRACGQALFPAAEGADGDAEELGRLRL